MNKFGIVLGVAAVATLAGCKDPNYRKNHADAYSDVKNVPATVPGDNLKPIDIANDDGKVCTCKPGTKHTAPCPCGGSDCTCTVVEPTFKPITVTPVATPATSDKPASNDKPAVTATGVAAVETTTYIVQNGDYLSKISKKFNITQKAILAANPGLNPDKIRIGQKIQLPGKVEVGEQKTPANAIAPAVKKVYVPYTGETKEYVVKSGDTLGAIAYGNGINIRQLKELNSLTGDSIRVGQKLRIPANGKSAVKADAAKADAAAKSVSKPVDAPKATAVEPKADDAAAKDAVTVPAVEPAKPVAEPANAGDLTTYQVQDGDDITGISIRWGVSAAAVREINNLAEDARLTPGQLIKLPEGADAQQ